MSPACPPHGPGAGLSIDKRDGVNLTVKHPYKKLDGLGLT
jgi:hypothetical protein